jgi:serine/threonine-protein kinase
LLAPGNVIAGYRIVGVLGQGGMGRVYEAVQISLDRTVALKILRDDFSADEGFRARFRREGRVQAKLSHRHIVGVHDSGEVDGQMYIAMQLIRGRTLKALIASGELGAARALTLLAQVADALDAAHQERLIHRDVKPQNVLVGAGDHAYLADFGLSKMPSDSGAFTRTGGLVGTFDYVSPEQISGEPATAASDVYALGAMLYESLSGDAPFGGRSEAAVLFAHVTAEPPRLSEVRPDLPAELDAVVARAMHKEPAQRPLSARSVIEQAQAALNAAGGGGGRAVPPRGAPAPAPVGGGAARAPPLVAEAFPPTMEPGSRLIPPESDPGFRVPDVPPGVVAPPPVVRTVRVRRRAAARAAMLVPAACAVGAGLVAGLHHGRAQAAAPATLIGSGTNGALAVRWPAGWAPARISALGAALHLKDPIALSDDHGAAFAGGLVRGPVTPGLLSAALRVRPGRALRVRAGGYPAHLYEDVRLPGVDGGASVIAVPTSAGVLTLACGGPGLGGVECGQIAASATLREGRALPLAPDAAYARKLRAALLALRRARKSARDELAHAAGPKRQAAAATTAASAFARADHALAEIEPGPAEAPLHATLRSALTRTDKAYNKLAGAARDGSRTRYADAARAIHAGETATDDAISAFRTAGYPAG